MSHSVVLEPNPKAGGTSAKAGPKRVDSIQVMRGLAALAVVFYHVYIILRQPEYGGNEILPMLAKHGLLGVNFFFILSGFIILFAHRSDLNRPDRLPRYLYRRAIRLYPAYWVFLTAYIVAAAVGLGYPDFSWETLKLLSAYLLIDLNPPASLPLKVAWTLLFEIKFYIAFAVMLFSVRAGVALFAIWMVAVVAAYFLGIRDAWNILSPWNVYFVFGMGVYLVLNRLDRRAALPALVLGVAMVVVYAANFNLTMSELKGEYEYVLFWLAPAFSLIILGAVMLERQHNYNMPKFLMFFGDASYSVYLVHSAAISVCALVAKKIGVVDLLHPNILFVVLFLFGTFAGLIAHVVVERPLLAYFRNRFFDGPGRMPPVERKVVPAKVG